MIGDVQGCRPELERLLDKIGFDPAADRLWLTGDLVNRGGDSLGVLRLLYKLRKRTRIVLGNHDLALLAGARKPARLNAELREVVQAEDGQKLLAWLASQPLLHDQRIATEKGARRFVMTHAGIPHLWSLKKARGLAAELEKALARSKGMGNLWGDRPLKWQNSLRGWDRLRCALNYLTRMRLVDAKGRMDLLSAARDRRKGVYRPWFAYPLPILEDKRNVLVFGHWAALNGKTRHKRIWGLDTGCVWGNFLTARRAEDGREVRQRAKGKRRP